MNSLIELFKKPLFQASLIGAFGGIAPKLIELIPKLTNNIFPSSGHLIALALLALIGGIIILVYKEENLQKALVLGAGAPALLAALTAQAVAPSEAGAILPFQLTFIETAYAQSADSNKTFKLVFAENESPYRLNKLWIRADGTTMERYKIHGDTLVVSLPSGTKEILVDLGDEGQELTVPTSAFDNSNTMNLKITNAQQTKDFWETFGSKSVPKYKIDKAK